MTVKIPRAWTGSEAASRTLARAAVLRKLPAPLEHDEQVAVIKWFEQYAMLRWRALRLPDGRPGIFATPNGGERNIKVAARLKAEGVSSGVPDLYVPALRLWVEMKRTEGADTSPNQETWHDYLRAIGDTVVVAYGAAEAIAYIADAAARRFKR